MSKIAIGKKGFHHLAVKVRDYEKSLEFYINGLGLEVKYQWGEVGKRAAMIDLGNDNYIEVFEGGNDKAEEKYYQHFALATDDCDAAIEKARAAGAKITDEPFDFDIQSEPIYPVRIAFCKGPDEEIIEFFQER